MNWNELKDQAYRTSVAHGFHQGGESAQHYLCLVVTELAEAVEADRHKRHADQTLLPHFKTESHTFPGYFEQYIKDTVEDELADAVIRLLDLAGLLAIDLSKMEAMIEISKECNDHKYLRPESFTEWIYSIIQEMCKNIAFDAVPVTIANIADLCSRLNINLEAHINLKMKYNLTRPNKHGKEY